MIVEASEIRKLLGPNSDEIESEITPHPIVESEKQRHEEWGHVCIDITRLGNNHYAYLCSCGIEFSAGRFE